MLKMSMEMKDGSIVMEGGGARWNKLPAIPRRNVQVDE
jgi:hypothetical protein